MDVVRAGRGRECVCGGGGGGGETVGTGWRHGEQVSETRAVFAVCQREMGMRGRGVHAACTYGWAGEGGYGM